MIALVFQKYHENFEFHLFIVLQEFTREFCYFLKKYPKQFLLSLLFINKTLRLSILKTRIAKNAKISVFVICVEAMIYVLYNMYDCTLNGFYWLTVGTRQNF